MVYVFSQVAVSCVSIIVKLHPPRNRLYCFIELHTLGVNAHTKGCECDQTWWHDYIDYGKIGYAYKKIVRME